MFTHELGHQIGLWSEVFDGIDSKKYTWNEYPSVMNYNRPTCSYYEIAFEGCTGNKKLQYTNDDWQDISNALSEELPYNR